MDEKTIVIQMLESEENQRITTEAIELLKRHFGDSFEIVPGVIKKPK
jgi:hypothetical protein